MKLTWKQIEARRERRLWITQIGAPLAILSLSMVIAFKDEIRSGREKLKNKIVDKKNRIVNKLKSKKETGQN